MDEMLNMPVTLIVKAPNQQVEDQTIHCELNWTIKKLKSYLSEVYPSKPRAEDQKLIYSGHLLQDSLVLKDVLRRDDGHDTHTVHLVCTSSRDTRRHLYNYNLTRMSRPDTGSRQQRHTTGEPSSSHASTSSDHSDDGLRHRTPHVYPQAFPNTANIPVSQPDMNAMWNATGMGYPYMAMPTSADPSIFAQQYILMQQYYAQYLAHLQSSASQNGQFPAINPTVPQTEPSPAPERPETPEAEQNRAGRQQENEVVEPEEEEGGGNRDWLDWFYLTTRLLILLSIVYFYSSLTRFTIVLTLAVLLFLYRRGHLQVQHVQHENNNNVRAARLVAPNNNAEHEENLPDANRPGDRRNVIRAETRQREVPEHPPLATILWTMVTSFFTSLIPEQPAAI